MIRNRKIILKYLLLISVLMLMMFLCACRTRLTNNTEVTSTITDEDGLMTENYEMRREDLGIPVAERPIFTGWSSDDDEDYYDDDYDESFDSYDPDADEWEEPEDSSSSSSSTSSSNSSTSRPTNIRRRIPGTGSDDEEDITITLDLNDGTGFTKAMEVKENTPYEKFLPDTIESNKDDLQFAGWTKDKKNKNPVDLKDKATEDETLYAKWKKKKQPKKTKYKLTWKYDSDVTVPDADQLPSTIKKGGNYPDPLPVAHKKNYRFLGWDDGSGLISAGQQCTEDSTLVAVFADDSWDKIYNDIVPAEAQKQSYVTENGTDDLVRGNAWDAAAAADEGPAYVIVKLTEGEFTDDAARERAKNIQEKEIDIDGEKVKPYKNSIIIVVPKDATKAANELYYSLILHDIMYGVPDGLDPDQLAKDTEASSTAYYIYPEPEA